MDANKIEVFLPGEVVDLCVPSDDPWILDQWFRWFNSPKTTAYLDQGLFPNTYENQKKYVESVLQTKERLTLLIKPKDRDRFIGVCSLSSIDLVKKSCQVAVVIAEHGDNLDSMFYGLEAKARLTEHAFETMGILRVTGTQSMDLARWQKLQILLGYQTEGILRNAFNKGLKQTDVILSACILEDYLKIKELRKGQYWPGKAKLFELMRNLPEVPLWKRLSDWLVQEQRSLWGDVRFE